MMDETVLYGSTSSTQMAWLSNGHQNDEDCTSSYFSERTEMLAIELHAYLEIMQRE
jgi:hypothetical protein